MKQYFILDGRRRVGPYNLEQLRAKSLDKQTPVWYEGLEKWTTVGNLGNAGSTSPSPGRNGSSNAPEYVSLLNRDLPEPTPKNYSLLVIVCSIVIGCATIAWFIHLNNRETQTIPRLKAEVSAKALKAEQKNSTYEK